MAFDLTNMLSENVQNMTESATLRMAQKARDLAASGVKVISLSIGEPDFDTPDHIKAAAKEGLDKGFTKYTPVSGLIEYKKAIVHKLKEENGLSYDVSQIMVSNGAKQTIANICMALLNPGDEVIILAPYWVSYIDIVKFCKGEPVEVYAGIEQDYKVKPEQLASAITDKTKLVIFSSPCNPTGSVYTKSELEGLAEVLKKHDNLIVLSDEIYEYINFDGVHASIAQVEGMYERTAVVNGMSKGFSMTGWRLGYMAGPKWLAEACNKIQGQITSGATSFGQYAAAVALTADKTATQEMTAAFHKRRDLVIELLSEIPGMKTNRPAGAFYIFPDISYYFGKSDGNFTIQNAEDFESYMLTEAHVAVVGGGSFGAPNCFRISYAASEEDLRTAIASMKRVLEKFA